MPKRKHYKDETEEDYILRKIRKLERKIRRPHRRRRLSSSSPSPSMSAPLPSPTPEETSEDRENPVDLEPGLEPEEHQEKEMLEDDILQVLGGNIKKSQDTGTRIHDQVAERWEDIIQHGLDKGEKENILQQNYILPPSNCPHLIVPKMNPETLAACTESNKKRDFVIEARQRMLSHVIAGLASATEKVLTEVQPRNLKLSLLEILNNTGKILADVFHNENNTRRNLIISGLEKEVRETLRQTQPDKFLFGDNLFEKIKTAKTVGRTGREIRIQPRLPPKNSYKDTQLNWRGPPRQTQKQQQFREPRANKSRSSGPRQPTTQRRGVAPSRGYRRPDFNRQHRRN